MIDAEGLFLVEEFSDDVEYDVHEGADGVIALPAADRKPSDAGFFLSWREYPLDGPPYRRTGVVVALAPRARSVWVRPDDPRPGEGYAVVVDNVTKDDCADAHRRVGVPADYLSTEGWQHPSTLTRALVRVDRLLFGDDVQVRRHLHVDPACPWPSGFMADRVTRGRARRVQTCYVFQDRLHPASVRPPDRKGRRVIGRVSPCGKCLKEGRPA